MAGTTTAASTAPPSGDDVDLVAGGVDLGGAGVDPASSTTMRAPGSGGGAPRRLRDGMQGQRVGYGIGVQGQGAEQGVGMQSDSGAGGGGRRGCFFLFLENFFTECYKTHTANSLSCAR